MKQLSANFSTRQYMEKDTFEIFYYNDKELQNVSPHQHDSYEFYFFLEGNVTYGIDGMSYELKKGDFLLIPPGILHGPIFGEPTPYRRFVLWISDSYLQKLCSQNPDYNFGFSLAREKSSYHFTTDFAFQQEIQSRLINLLEEAGSGRPFSQTVQELMVNSFLLFINRIIYDQFHQNTVSYEKALYLNLCDYINQHLEENLALDKLASFFFVSKYHISHIFKDNMGISLHQYILKKRLHACKNGILSGIPINTIYQQYGFHDYTSFYRAFKKEYGLSPKEFKSQNVFPKENISGASF